MDQTILAAIIGPIIAAGFGLIAIYLKGQFSDIKESLKDGRSKFNTLDRRLDDHGNRLVRLEEHQNHSDEWRAELKAQMEAGFRDIHNLLEQKLKDVNKECPYKNQSSREV